MDIVTFVMMVITVLGCGMGAWAWWRLRRVLDAQVAGVSGKGARTGADFMDVAGEELGVDFVPEVGGDRGAVIGAGVDRVLIVAELVGGAGDGLCLVADKDVDLVYFESGGERLNYVFANRSRDGRWVFEYAPVAKVKG